MMFIRKNCILSWYTSIAMNIFESETVESGDKIVWFVI